MPFLVWDSPRGRVVYEITRSLSVLGRDAGCDLQLEETSVSRRHALVEMDGGRVRVTDLGSKGRTRINGADLTPDLPSTLEAGDFINLGRVTLTYHVTPPPPAAQPKPERPAPPSRPAAPAPASTGASPVWKYVALGLAFVLVAVIGAVVALQLNARQPVQVVQIPGLDPEPEPDPEPAPPARVEREPEPEMPPAKVETGPSEAPAGMLPPAVHATIDLCPDLICMEGDLFFPVRLRDWDRQSVQALGSDGRLYRIDFAQVERIADRADLERRAAELRRKLPEGDVEGRLALAQWCAQRFIYAEARTLANEVMGMDPMRSEAKAILTALGDA
jgi:hypothetical protein